VLRKFLSVLAIPALAVLAFGQAETWKIDPNHTAAQFSVRHLGISTVRGAFNKTSGSVTYDAANPSKSSVEATIEVASVDTRVEMRDNDLRSPNWFDAAKFPAITFKSTKVEAAGAGKLKVTGDLTIHGVTKSVVLDIDGPSAPMTDQRGNSRVGASATTKINRKDFGVGTNPAVGDEITITIDTELSKPNPNAPPPPPPPTK
jgi:polyisoprenoid-binding protein YceI